MLARAGLKREDVFITNIVKHRPPGNRDPMPDEIEACGEYLERQIAEIKPVLIVTLGRHSMMQFFGPNARITQVHGTLRPWRDIMAYACFHPAAALHQPKYREMLEQDFDGLPKALEAARKRAAEQAQQPAQATARRRERRDRAPTRTATRRPSCRCSRPWRHSNASATSTRRPTTRLGAEARPGRRLAAAGGDRGESAAAARRGGRR